MANVRMPRPGPRSPDAPLPPLPPRQPPKNGRPHGTDVMRSNKPSPPGTLKHANGQIANPAGPHSKGRHTNWNARHQLILYMDIAGERVVDIAQKLNMMASSISAIKGSPLYQTQKAQLLEQLAGTTFENLKDLIASPRIAIKNVEVLAEIRDSAMQETRDRISAARVISREVDRVYPRTTKHEEQREIRISIDASRLQRIASTLQEIGANAIDAATLVDLAPDVDEGPTLIEGKSIDQLRDELAARVDDSTEGT